MKYGNQNAPAATPIATAGTPTPELPDGSSPPPQAVRIQRVAEPLLLAVETSHGQGSVALAAGPQLLAARALSADRRHASELLPAIADLLRDCGHKPREIDLFAWSAGPGSFTGLRVAATLGQMLQSAITCRVVAVPTLAVIARNALTCSPAANPPAAGDRPGPRDRISRLAVILDARGGRIYGGLFERQGGEFATLQPAGAFELDAWLAQLGAPVAFTGEGLRKHGAAIAATGATVLPEDFWPPRAENVAAIGWTLAQAGHFCRPEEIVPHYIRPPECEEVYDQRRAEARHRRGE